jgi:DeoR/GlpR family transcriptional regulator of sugar metabolism
MTEGTVRIEQLAERFDISLMTVHRDLDELEAQGLLRKSRGIATALPNSLVESSDVFRGGQQIHHKRALAEAAITFIEPGQAVFLDDSTTVQQITPLLPSRAPLTIITNFLTNIAEINKMTGITLVSLGGTYHNWCSSFMGRMTTTNIELLRADVFIMSTAAITDDICFHQSPETVDTKRAMFDVSAKRILLADHTKFEKRALYGLAKLTEFDHVIVDSETREEDVDRLRGKGVKVVVAKAPA